MFRDFPKLKYRASRFWEMLLLIPETACWKWNMKIILPRLLLTALCLNITANNLVLAEEKQVLSQNDAPVLYQTHCASCHGQDRLGLSGPALLPENLSRLRKAKAIKTITYGKVATQMQAFAPLLNQPQIQALADYIYTPLAQMPVWNEAEIKASHIVHVPELATTKIEKVKPVYSADPLNLFLVVETGDHHVSVLDGDKLEVIHRFPSRFALHGGPKYTADGRFVYFASRDGWISKFDMHTLKMVAEIRAAINTRNIAVSADNRYVIVGNYLPHTLVLLNASDLSLIKIIPVIDSKGNSSRVSAVYTARPRNSFVVALKDFPEAWEISYDDEPPAGFGNWVHDYRKDSGDVRKMEKFPIRRIQAEGYLDDFFFDQDYILMLAASRQGGGQVIDLDARRVISKLDLPGMPHLGSGITWSYQDKPVFATPNLKTGNISIIDMQNWQQIKNLKTLGPGFFMRSHETSDYAWVDVFFGKNRDAMHVIDKNKLEIVKTLRPVPGKTAAHVEFDRYGKYAIVSIWDKDGAIIIYDAKTLEEIKRIPMNKPSGKYNVYNKITLSAGTSH
ncbi:Nitrite reductase precursor [Candidatus Venteria ishoeyi]|uniref:Nitrite reductase n=2 Tax=Candidatus Venteria ishoeyi TaxID=1899563 RepID=A0A1H6FEY7_9GAMM|nr:Nitrite reductase precursor [Candidatus Venteria ishoeyi]